MPLQPAEPSKVSQLIDMGLTSSQAITALERAGNDLEKALALHFGYGDPPSTGVSFCVFLEEIKKGRK